MSVGDAEGEHGEVVVLLGAVAELVGVGLEGLLQILYCRFVPISILHVEHTLLVCLGLCQDGNVVGKADAQELA